MIQLICYLFLFSIGFAIWDCLSEDREEKRMLKEIEDSESTF